MGELGGLNLYSFKIPKKLCGRTGGFARIDIYSLVIKRGTGKCPIHK